MIGGGDRGWVPACAGTTVWVCAVHYYSNDGAMQGSSMTGEDRGEGGMLGPTLPSSTSPVGDGDEPFCVQAVLAAVIASVQPDIGEARL